MNTDRQHHERSVAPHHPRVLNAVPMITVVPIKYDKSTLANVPPDECALHFMMAQIGNDVATRQKHVFFSFNKDENELEFPVGAARTASGMMLAGFLAGRLYEAWTLLRERSHSGPPPTQTEKRRASCPCSPAAHVLS